MTQQPKLALVSSKLEGDDRLAGMSARFEVTSTAGNVLWSGNAYLADLVMSLRDRIAEVVKRPSGTIKILCGLIELDPHENLETAVLHSFHDPPVLTAVLLPMHAIQADFRRCHTKRFHVTKSFQINRRRSNKNANACRYICDACQLEVPGCFADIRDEYLYCEQCDFGICWWCLNGDYRDGRWLQIEADGR
mmetsp:Transcript_81449/g.143842  ORF Transcript_81449/g.143842 Transcript_81449/m.143842 type:complete len:192 (-) Transcript_81449:128-703(-)